MTSTSHPSSRIGWRITYHESAENLLIKILAPKDLNLISLLIIFLVVWGYIVFGQLRSEFNSGFACVSIVVVLLPLYAFLWNIVGKEVINIDTSKIVVRQIIFGVGFQQTYQLSRVNNLRVFSSKPAIFTLEHNMQEWGFAGGSIAFDYEGKLCRFGLSLRKQDADILVTKINQYLAHPGQNSFTLADKA